MLNLLKSIFARCQHVWVQYATADIMRRRLDGDDVTAGKASFCRCEKCGARRLFKMVL